ncbi:MAG: proprotein convertase P-domain-containing protein [Bacteroidota bacterium]
MAFSQSFFARGSEIADFKEVGHYDTFSVVVNNLPKKIDTSFGLSRICINAVHKRVSDLKIQLLSPDGNSIWLTNRNGADSGRDLQGTCFRSNGFNGYIHQANAPFEGEFIPDGRMEFINNGQNPNGKWSLLVQDLKAEVTGKLYDFSLEFSSQPMPGLVSGPCSFENPGPCICTSTDSILQPDLAIIPVFTDQQIKEYEWNDPNYPGQLRFAATIGNLGEGPFEIEGDGKWHCGGELVSDGKTKCPDGSYPRQNLIQKLYRKSVNTLVPTERVAGTNYFDTKPGHEHYHVDDWVEFILLDFKKSISYSIKKRREVARSRKVSYCLFDSGICSNRDSICLMNGIVMGEKNLTNYGLGNYASCKEKNQGISVGGYDTYGMMYEGQFIQLPKRLKTGYYLLLIQIDPQNKYVDINRSNNLYIKKIFLSKQNKS